MTKSLLGEHVRMSAMGRKFLILSLVACATFSAALVRADKPITREEIENRRQELVVTAMNFSNDGDKRKFLEVYVPYQEKLMQILKGRAKLVEQFAAEQKNGAMPDPEASQILKKSLELDGQRLKAEQAYVAQLGKILPPDQVLRAYQIETRINALYLAVVFDTVPLVR